MFRLVKSPPCPTIARFGSCGGITLIGTQGSHIEARPLATEISWPQGDPELALGTENCSLAADDSLGTISYTQLQSMLYTNFEKSNNNRGDIQCQQH